MNEQLYIFGWMMATGAGLGFLYDCYRLTRRAIKPSWLVSAAGDLLYWAAATAVVFLSLLYSNWGELRFYVFLGLLSGSGLYFKLASRYIYHSLLLILRTGRQVVRFILSVLHMVLIRPLLWTIRIILYPFGLAGRGLLKLARNLRPRPK